MNPCGNEPVRISGARCYREDDPRPLARFLAGFLILPRTGWLRCWLRSCSRSP